MLASYVRRELLRNPRRTLAALTGITLGVALFSSVLFFIDGSGASMTRRALAPLAIDIQSVIGTSGGRGLELAERLTPAGRLSPGQTATLTLTVSNRGRVPANEVVLTDAPPSSLAYVRGSSALNGRHVIDPASGSPLSQAPAQTGLNLGTVGPGSGATFTYLVRASAAIDTRPLRLLGRISSQENLIPTRANAATPPTIDELARQVRGIPGVAAADTLAFVDLPPGSLTTAHGTIRDTVRVFGLGAAYRRHYPSVRLVSGSLQPGGAALSAESAQTLGAGLGTVARLRLPGGSPPLMLPVTGIADLSRARPLFYSRMASNLEAFLYLPHTVIVDPTTFQRTIIPAFQAASASRRQSTKTEPLLELDVLLNRAGLQSDPGTALSQTQKVTRTIRQLSPSRNYVIDNASNTLQVARDDAAVAKRMFLFLGLPGALLAAFLAAYAGNILASAQRREQALLRIRGADQGHLLRMLLYRTLALAGTGSVAGALLGLISVLVILGPTSLFATSVGALVVSGAISVVVGMLCTALALYVPGRAALHREISQDRAEIALGAQPAWRRLRLDLVLLVVTAIAEIWALRTGAFNAPAGSVYQGRAVSLPSHLLLAPVGVWVAGVLLSVRAFDGLASRARLPRPARFGSPVWGCLVRSLRRRSWSLAGGVAAVGLVVAFGTSLVVFTSTYDAAKGADARFVVGSDIRITPSVLSRRPHPASFSSRLLVPGVAAAAPVVFKPQNAVLTTAFNEDQKSLAALDPTSFAQTAALSDRFFVHSSAAGALQRLGGTSRSVLVSVATAADLKVSEGDSVLVLLARGTPHQVAVKARVVGMFNRLPGFPQSADLVMSLRNYQSATHTSSADYFLARTADSSQTGLDAAVSALAAGPGAHDRLNIDTTRTTLDKDQSSLTALNVHGLLDLDSLYTLLMAAASIAIFVFGLMLQRRREYVTLRAQGLQTRELRTLVLSETAAVTGFGVLAGAAIGTVMGYLLVRVLQPLFVLGHSAATLPLGTLALAALVLLAAVVSGLAGTELLRRLRPTELLRET